MDWEDRLDDWELELELNAQLDGSDWVTLDVRDGVVHLGGLIESEAGRRATRVAAENVPGVRGVDDERMQTANFQPMF